MKNILSIVIVIAFLFLAFVGTIIKDRMLRDYRNNMKNRSCDKCSNGKCDCDRSLCCQGDCNCK